jgi:hypothetical protein
MKTLVKTVLLIILAISYITTNLDANEQTFTDISFNQDKDGNINPNIYIPIYYTKSKKFYSAIGYSSSDYEKTNKITNFRNSNFVSISRNKRFIIDYFSYQGSIFSIGIRSEFLYSKINTSSYILDVDNLQGKGTDYLLFFDNNSEFNLKRHGVFFSAKFDIIENVLLSRFTTNIYPYASIDVKQKIIYKSSNIKTGSYNSSNPQNLSYELVYEINTNFNSLINFGVAIGYIYVHNQYDILGLKEDKFYKIEADNINTTRFYTAKIIFNKKILGELNPYIGVTKSYEKIKIKNTDEITYSNNKLFFVGVEKRF